MSFRLHVSDSGVSSIPACIEDKELCNNDKLFNPLSTNPTKWSSTLKQFVGYCQIIV